ncbi:MAG: substrate-binding domain-containing protein [Chloroflexota bacterium]
MKSEPLSTNDEMTTFERRQRIVNLLNQQMSVKVTTLVELFDVSETTIRNDLAALETEHQLKRVRGGAVSIAQAPHATFPTSRTMKNAANKQKIAQWAAGNVEDGQTILLDASTTVLCMTPFLQEHRNLTIVTNGIDLARSLAEHLSNTVVLIGGVVNKSGSAIISQLDEQQLAQIQFDVAFVSGVGFSLETGLSERHIEEARLKAKLLARAKRTIALVDSSKLGVSSLAPVSSASAIGHLVTDQDADPQLIDQFKSAGLGMTICGDDTVTNYAEQAGRHRLIGFANLSEQDSHIALDVRRGLEKAAQAQNNVDIIVADNRLDPVRALAVADEFIEQAVDLMIEYQIDYRTNSLIMKKFQSANIPVIAVDIPIVGATFFGVDNYQAGHMAGVALGEWIDMHWEGSLDAVIVLIEPRAGSLPEARIQGQIDGLQEHIGDIPSDGMHFLDCGNTSSVSESQVTQKLHELADCHRIAVLSFNDDAAYGALQAAQSLSRTEQVAIVGQGADRILRSEIRRPHSPVIGSTAFFPEAYGEKLMSLAIEILEGRAVPPAVYMEHVFINQANINVYYPD